MNSVNHSLALGKDYTPSIYTELHDLLSVFNMLLKGFCANTDLPPPSPFSAYISY
jgi:hypothetical protein